MSTSDAVPDGEPANLLETILGDEILSQQIGDADADSNTITLSVPAVTRSDFRSNVDQLVPRRNVETLSRRSGTQADYRLVGELGSGGTGVVFQAHQRAIDREVAIKMLRSELAVNPISRERFLTEARVIGGLDHPNVIALHEVYVDDDDNLYYSMKRIDGTSWDRQMAGMTDQQNLDILLRVADAIRYAHSRGLIHRDIKPENIMLGRFGEVLLADWGLAVYSDRNSSDEDIHQSIGGTPAYMAPELAGGIHSDIVFRTDVYLLGANLFQILTGHPPHDGGSLLECIHNAANNVIRESDIDNELMGVAKKAMATRPEDRYDDVNAFIEAIQAHRLHEQSNRLVRRALRQISESDQSEVYRDFSIADALLSEAIDVWPENWNAISTKKQFQMKLASIASRRGDLDLAATIYESIGEHDSESARAIRFERMKRDASQRRVSRFSALFTNSPDAGLLLQISSGKIVEANDAFAKLFGYKSSDVVGKAIEELILWASAERRQELVDHVDQRGQVDDFEATLLHCDGHRIEVLISVRTAMVQDEEMLVSTIRDISIRKQFEQELKASRQRLRDLQRLAGLATWSYDAITDKVTWSRETFDLTGRNHDEGSPSRQEYYEMIHPEDRPRLERAVKSAIESGVAYEISIQQLVASGQYQEVIVRGQPIFDDEGKTIEVYGVVLPK